MSKLNAKSLAEAIAAALAPVLVAAFGGAASNDADDGDGEEEAAPKKGRGRPAGSTKTKTETKPAAKGKGKAKDEEEEEEDDDGLGDDGDDDLGLGDEEEEVTQEDVVNAFKALKASKGIDKCREVLAKLDESNVLNIPPKKYAEALKEINRAGSKK
ncbi:hypothetical protein [Xylella phage Bacata]|nr:hypothetical protein JT315_gp63 [Xylella phage Bacata]CAA2367841.1 hypothetical protein [Xylella phage Bacata]